MRAAGPEARAPWTWSHLTASWLIPCLLTLGVLFAYSNGLSASFLFDDYHSIVRNPEIGNLRGMIVGSSRPVTDASFFLCYALAGPDPAFFRGANILIHLGCTLLLFGVLRLTLALPWATTRWGRLSPWWAATAAGIWALHPLQTAAVTYIVQRAESLMSFLYLLTLYCMLRGSHSTRPRAWYGGAIAACALGMATKAPMVTAPLILLLYDRTFLAGTFRQAWALRWRLYVALVSTWVLLGTVLMTPNESSSSAGLSAGLISPAQYLVTQLEVVAHYMILFVNPGRMCLDYAWPVTTPDMVSVLLVAGFTTLLMWSVWSLARGQQVGFGLLWFFIILSPSSSLIPVADYAFDHRVYLAGVGPLVTLVLVGGLWLRERAPTVARPALALTILLTLSGLTVARNADYQTEETMWRDVVRKRPRNLRAINDLAVTLSERGAFAEAAAHYQQVLDTMPSAIREALDRGEVRDAGEGGNSYRRNYLRAHANLGLMHYQLLHDPATAAEHYHRALGVNPGDAAVKAKLDVVETLLSPVSSNGSPVKTRVDGPQ